MKLLILSIRFAANVSISWTHLVHVVVDIDGTSTQISAKQGGMSSEDGGDI